MKKVVIKCAEIALLTTAIVAFSGMKAQAYEDTTKRATAGIAIALENYYQAESTDGYQASKAAIDQILSLTPQVITSVVEGYTNLGVANVENYLNVREAPDQNAKVLGKLPMNAGCEVLEQSGGWYKIQSGEVTGYVSGEFLLTGQDANTRATEVLKTVATVNADKLKIRQEPNTDSSVIMQVAQGEDLSVEEVLDGWVKISVDGEIGYVSAEFVTVSRSLPKGVTIQELQYGGGVSNTVVDLIAYAKQFLGNAYVYGGSSLTNGTDCSGFTMRIFEKFGYSLSHSSAAQSKEGTRVDISEIQPGDLLFYSNGGSIGHVALYIGNGKIIHASTEKTGIIISNAFYRYPTCAVRIIN